MDSKNTISPLPHINININSSNPLILQLCQFTFFHKHHHPPHQTKPNQTEAGKFTLVTTMPYVPADAQLITCESIIDYTFSNKLLGLEALNTAGQGNPLLYGGRTYADIPKNKVMAQYGDAIADFVVMGVWMRGVSSQSARFYNSTFCTLPPSLPFVCLSVIDRARCLLMRDVCSGRVVGRGQAVPFIQHCAPCARRGARHR